MTAGDSSSPVFDFTSLDTESVSTDLKQYAQSRFPDSVWTDFNESNPLTHVLELMAYATDLLAYNQNASTLETIPATVIREQNFRNLAKSLDYTLKSAAPSNTTLSFTTNTNPLLYPFTISRHLQLVTGDGVVFQPDADIVVSSPVSSVTGVLATQGHEFFEEVLGVSTGQPGQVFQLGNPDLIDGTLEIVINSVLYTQVQNAVASGPTDKVYTVDTNESGISIVTFGDGVNGIVPPISQTILATYKTGGGSNTNYPIGTITNISGTSDGSSVPTALLTVTNTTAAEGGGPKQSLQNAKNNLPLSLKANDRAVTFEDFSALAVELVTGVLKAHATAGIASGGSIPVLIFVVPDGGGNPTPTLANEVVQALKPKKLAGKRVVVSNPVYVHLDIEGDIYVNKNALALVVQSRVTNTFLNKYSMENVDFASEFALQDAYDSVAPSQISGVSRVFLKKFTVKPYFSRYVNVPTNGTGSVIGIIVNNSVLRREWFVEVVSPILGITCNEFIVTQRQLGKISAVTDTLLVDDSADYDANSLAGKELHIRPQELSTTFTIISNTTQDIQVSGGLLSAGTIDDPYVVESVESVRGKILSAAPTTDIVINTNVITLSDTTNWLVGDSVYLVNGDNTFTSTIATVNPGVSIVLNDNIPFGAFAASTTVYYQWVSSDGTLRFVVADDTSVGGVDFTPGDKFFVDTFATAGDILLRDENFPLLEAGDMVFNTIGGVK